MIAPTVGTVTRTQGAIDPISLDLVLSGREITEPRPSPDGRWVAFVQRWRSAATILVVPVGGGPERMLVTPVDPAPARGAGGGCLAWCPSSDGLLYSAVDGELWRVLLTGDTRRVTNLERSCRAPAVSPDGGRAAVSVDDAEIWVVGWTVGHDEARRVDDNLDSFCFDPVFSPDGERLSWQAWSPPDMPWDGAQRVTIRTAEVGADRAVERWSPPDGAVQQPRFLPDGRPICVHDGTGWLNVCTADGPVVGEPSEHAGPTWGPGQRSYAVSEDGSAVAFHRNEDGFGRLCVVDRVTGDVVQLGRGVHGQIEWVGEHITALRGGARTPTQIVQYAVPSGERTTLAVGPSASWDALDLPEPEVVEVTHDGCRLVARRYAAGQGRMICWVHGGPTDQWMVDFRPRISYWWSRGWDVLVVDPRGTTGHGRVSQRALNGRWGRRDVDDSAVLVRRAHDLGWSSPATTVAMGSSAGGLTVLGVLADHGDLFAGGVASYPVSDLRALAEVTYRFEAHYTETLVGPTSDGELFDRLSPISRAERIRGPLLVFHGADDPVVPLEQSRSLVAAVRRAGGDVQLVEYEGEGHGFRDPVNVRDEYERTGTFLRAVVTGSSTHG